MPRLVVLCNVSVAEFEFAWENVTSGWGCPLYLGYINSYYRCTGRLVL